MSIRPKTKTFEEMFLSSNEEERLKVSKLRILIVGNIKSNFMFVEKLKEWQLQNLEYFDYMKKKNKNSPIVKKVFSQKDYFLHSKNFDFVTFASDYKIKYTKNRIY